MKAVAQFTKLSIILVGLLIAMPQDSLAGNGGKSGDKRQPNAKSVAATAACIEPDGSAHVYSCKGISNVVLWCGSTYIKYDNIGSDSSTGDEREVYDDVFGCGDAVGPITYIAVKSGSQKHKKHHGDYTAPDGLPQGEPSGSGLFVGNIPSCPLTPEQIPTRGDCDIEPAGSGGDGGDGGDGDSGGDDGAGGAAVPIDPDDPNYPDDPPVHTGG